MKGGRKEPPFVSPENRMEGTSRNIPDAAETIFAPGYKPAPIRREGDEAEGGFVWFLEDADLLERSGIPKTDGYAFRLRVWRVWPVGKAALVTPRCDKATVRRPRRGGNHMSMPSKRCNLTCVSAYVSDRKFAVTS